jgi:hypothetical protein
MSCTQLINRKKGNAPALAMRCSSKLKGLDSVAKLKFGLHAKLKFGLHVIAPETIRRRRQRMTVH